jgi:diaminohydroxyphosphoribosylaminopyrimidine deaminase/5-amino-6-(5-phosphoribosylamino)uracil reductase
MPIISELHQRDRDEDERYMRAALRQAQEGLGKTSPNPAVGALIVRGGSVLSKGWHKKAGDPHAEIEALARLQGKSAEGGTLYVTLEPCSTHGRTPPCTDAIIAAKLARVVIGTIDMNPKHQGRGIKQLVEAGLEVTTGVLGEECRRLNAGFNKWIKNGQPWVIAKFAQSLDGRIARPPGESQWLTNHRSLRLARRLRSTVDAILVGAETVRQDNPKLTLRPARGQLQPWRIVITRSGILPPDSHLLTDEFRDRTLIYQNVEWPNLLKELGSRGITRLLIEGGGETLGQLRDKDLIDEVWCFISPLLTGGNKPSIGGRGSESMGNANRLEPIRYRRIGDDIFIMGYVRGH